MSVFNYKETVFFAGGIGTKAGVGSFNVATGVTKAKYDAMVVEDGYFDMSRIMDANGGYLHTEVIDGEDVYEGSYLECGVNLEALGVEAGMLAYIEGYDVPGGGGLFEIQEVEGYDLYFDEDIILADGEDVSVFIGGASASVRGMLNYTNSTLNDVWILTNKTEPYGGTTSITNEGSLANDKHLYVWGFNTMPPTNLHEPSGDMDYGGAYYASALDIKINGSVPGGKKVCLRGPGASQFNLFNLTSCANIHFININFGGMTTGFDVFNLSSTTYGLTFHGCAFTRNYYYLFDGSATYGWLFHDCYFERAYYHTSIRFDAAMYGCLFLNCVMNLASSNHFYAAYANYINCLFINGDYGLRLANNHAYNCTFYNQDIAPVTVNNSSHLGHIFNSIIIPKTGASDFAIDIQNGSMGAFMNNCYYGADGAALTKPFNDENDAAFTPFGGGNLAQDPAMVDPANNNFKPTNRDLLTGGLPDASGNAGQIGAVTRKHRFQGRPAMGRTATKRFFR